MLETDLNLESLQQDLATCSVGSSIHHFDSLLSTMDRAKEEAEAGAHEGTVILADEQTRGRGRFSREWLSPKGSGLLFSVILRPRIEQLSQINMAAALTVARAIRILLREAPSIKWPNDVRIGGKKVAGILIENTLEGATVKYCVVGIGLNVNWHPPREVGLAYPATSLSREIGKPLSRTGVLKVLLVEMDRLYARVKSGGSLRKEWAALLDTIGKQVRIGAGGQVLEGVAKDVDNDGNLVLAQADGAVVTVAAGEVTLQA